jgi:hypothetical protein
MMYPSSRVKPDKKFLAVAQGLSGGVTAMLKLTPAVTMALLNWSLASTSTSIGSPAVTLVGMSTRLLMRCAVISATTVTATGNVC